MRICVYCSSSDGVNPSFKRLASDFGKWLATEGHTLVYGGATGGLMTAVAESAFSNGGQVIGVIPPSVEKKGRKAPWPITFYEVSDLGERKKVMKEYADLFVTFYEVSDLGERKKVMKEYADLFVVLPGSFGTMDEMLDTMVAGILGEHNKPMIIVNVDGFFNHFLMLVERMKKDGMLSDCVYSYYVADNLQECISLIKNI